MDQFITTISWPMNLVGTFCYWFNLFFGSVLNKSYLWLVSPLGSCQGQSYEPWWSRPVPQTCWEPVRRSFCNGLIITASLVKISRRSHCIFFRTDHFKQFTVRFRVFYKIWKHGVLIIYIYRYVRFFFFSLFIFLWLCFNLRKKKVFSLGWFRKTIIYSGKK